MKNPVGTRRTQAEGFRAPPGENAPYPPPTHEAFSGPRGAGGLVRRAEVARSGYKAFSSGLLACLDRAPRTPKLFISNLFRLWSRLDPS
jgi:hypothetical protein